MEDKNCNTNKKDKNIDNYSIFSNENVNLGHQPEIDYFKTVGVFLIAIVHVYNNYSQGCLVKVAYFLSLILGAGGSMMQMGIGMKYSKHHDLKNYVSRAFILLTLGQYVNLIRNALPNFIAWWISGKKVYLSRTLLVLESDILTFAGIAFLFLVLLKKIHLSDKSMLIIGIIMNNAAFILYKIMKSPDNFLISQFLGYIVFTTNTESIFPLCSYFMFVAFGYWLGGIYQKILNKDKFYNRILTFCLPPAAIYYYLRSHYVFPILPKYITIEIYSLNAGPDAIASCLANLSALAIYYKINKIFKGKTPEFIKHAGKYFTQYYIISYTFTMQMFTFLQVTRGEKYTSEMKYPTLLGFMALFLSRILIDINNKYIHFTIIGLNNHTRKYVFTLIWIATIITVIYAYPKVDSYTTMWNDYSY